jgi:hypothetical protein
LNGKAKVTGCNQFYNAFSERDRQITLTTAGMLHFLLISKHLNLLIMYRNTTCMHKKCLFADHSSYVAEQTSWQWYITKCRQVDYMLDLGVTGLARYFSTNMGPVFSRDYALF